MVAVEVDAHAGRYDVSHLSYDKLDIGNLTEELRRVNIGRNNAVRVYM
jgi:hypothetical protein